MKVSVVMPAKNEAESLVLLIPQILEVLEGLDSEIIVVNDGSTDNTSGICQQFGIVEVRHAYSMGNGAAIKSGARKAAGEMIVFMDADGQHNPKDMLPMIEMIDQGYDLVVGARRSGSQASLPRAIANGFYNRLSSYMTGKKIQDLTSGYRCVRAERFREFLYLLPNGFSYPTTSTMAFFRAGYQVGFFPIVAAKRKGDSHVQPIKDGLRFLLIIFKVGTLYSPLKLFAPLASLLFLLGCFWYGYTYIEFGRFTNMSALLMTVGLMIFLMGLISEQITNLMYKA